MVNVIVMFVRLNVSPVFNVLFAARFAEYRKFPADGSSHTLMSLMVSAFAGAGHDVHDAVVSREIAPPEAAANDNTFRVVSALAPVAADAPGSVVCSFAYVFVSLYAVALHRASSHEFARVAETPSAMGYSFR
jgi:hypothetical protein